jgi:methyl-accepting chemotaxis protein
MNSFHNLPLRVRLMALSALLCLMALIPLGALINNRLGEWRFNQAEFSGLAPANALLTLTSQLQKHRGLSGPWLRGNTSTDAARREALSSMQTAFSDFEQSWQSAGFEGDALDQAKGVMRDFAALASDVESRKIEAPASFERHTALVDRLQHVLFKVGAASNLLYDPVDYTYLLIISGYQESPRVTELAARMRGLGTSYLTNHDGLASDVQLAQDSQGRLLERIGHIEMHLQAAAAAKPALLDTLVKPAREKLQALKTLSLNTRAILQGDTSVAMANLSAADYFKAASEPIEAQAKITQQIAELLKTALIERQAEIKHSLIVQGITVTVLAGFSLWAVIGISRSITQPVGRMQALAESLAKGDLTVNCATDRRDELGGCMRALETARMSWVDMLSDIKDTIANVSSASSQIAAGSLELSDRTVGVASSLAETTHAIGSLNQTVRHTADAADQANGLAQSAHTAARSGELVMSQVVNNMDNIATASKRIADILSVIDGIAFQTNILALNAAVEAARAGESGRGFAVVAGEVRILAQRSAQAAKEIKTLIDDSMHKVEAGTTLVHQAGTSMQAIMHSNDQVSGIVSEITAATREQSQGFAQVSTAIDNIDQMTTHNATLVQESNAAADALKTLADHLAQKVAIFRFEQTGAQVQRRLAPKLRPAALPAPTVGSGPRQEVWI